MELRAKVGIGLGLVVVGVVACVVTPGAPTPAPVVTREVVRARPEKKTEVVETPAGARHEVTRDAKDQVMATNGPAGKATLERDAAGRLVLRTDATGNEVRIAYDLKGRPSRFEAGGLVEGVARDGQGRLVLAFAGREALRFTHGDDGHVRVVDDRAGVALDYDRDASGREVVRTPFGATTWTRDAVGHVVGLDTPAGAFRFGYDAAGVPTSIEAPNGVRSTWTAQPGRDAILSTGPTGDVLSVERRLDHADRVAQVRRDGARADAAHDAAGRLTAWTSASRTTRFAYDADGARLLGGAEHDAAGRLVRQGDASGRVDRFAYDAFGRLSVVERAGRPAVAYTYDPFGRVATRTVSGATTRFVYEGARLLAQVGPGGARRTFVFGPGLDVPLAYSDGGAWTFLHADAQGHVLAYSDATGARVDRAAFDPWGVLEQAPAADRPVFFSGRLVDREAGLVNLRARWYDPALGRFLTPDPAGLRGGPSAYAYGAADPLRYIDPLGLWPEPSPLDHAEEPPAWLAERFAQLDLALPHEVRGAISETALVAWNTLDRETRENLRTPQATGLWLAALDQKLGEAARGFEANHKELAFLAGEVRGLGNAAVAMVESLPELGWFLADLGTVGLVAAHDAIVPAGQEVMEHVELKSGLSQVFAAGKQGELLAALFTEFDDRIAQASQKTGLLVEEGRHFEAGAAFGEGVLAEAAAWIQLAGGLARQGVNLWKLSPARRAVVLRRALRLGYKPGAGDQALKALAAEIKAGAIGDGVATRAAARTGAVTETAAAARTGAVVDAAAAKAPTAPATARNGLAQAIDENAARGAAPEAPKPVATEQAPVKTATPEPTRTAAAESRPTAEPAPEAPSDANRARGPPKEKTRGVAGPSLSDKGRLSPEPLRNDELVRVQKWEVRLHDYLKRWRDVPLDDLPEKTRELLRGTSTDNAIARHMTPDDMAAVLKEQRGVRIPDPREPGTFFDHITEARQARNSLQNLVDDVSKRLDRVRRKGAASGEIELLEQKLADLTTFLAVYPAP